ncbi:hypothetical protein SAMN05660380_00361 [Xylella fastidiosa]|uniref:Uncharacterized protein n=1 Tax=Xylella fastidiosa subsp. sandyi Ann-1 TaxID=155920 RepID=A0A060H673_XYLFS|nr:hypothetical protein D934_04380 [Xylella fastidiosa subsp. sandyi Ann-1]ERI59339.1 hypothetical protein M233_10135 [Xylella fastidiosa subsp. multiplex Griffin-1]KAF0572349.1 hypothetical protein P305_00515 [Xylella fastidiosa subsp. fastidiosa Mus-1]SHG29464.1 hypothetical protein SAMN05660380_00361 [Xylella fastidiosa]
MDNIVFSTLDQLSTWPQWGGHCFLSQIHEVGLMEADSLLMVVELVL